MAIVQIKNTITQPFNLSEMVQGLCRHLTPFLIKATQLMFIDTHIMTHTHLLK